MISTRNGFELNTHASPDVRNSSIELLRIVCIMMVLCLHYNKDILLVYDFQMLAFNRVLLCGIEALAIVAVNCFVLITGYYSTRNTKIKWRKIVDLVFLTSTYGGGIYLIGCVVNAETFTIKEFIKCLIPYFFDRVWFINCYIVLLLFSPFLNKLLRDLTVKSFRLLLALMLFFFSLCPTFLPYPLSNDKGYGIISFVLLYCIGFYLRQHNRMVEKARLWYAIAYVFFAIPTFLRFYWWGNGLEYNSIFIIISSVSFFCFFLGHYWYSGLVNNISKSVYAVLVIHTHHSIRADLYVKILKGVEHLNKMEFILVYAIDICLVFITCVLIDYARRIVFSESIDKVFDKNKIINSAFVIE